VAGGSGAGAARERLQRRADALRRTLATMEQGHLDRSLGDSVAELSTYDNHPADLGTETWNRTQALALRAALEHTLAEVGEALRRLEEGGYGRCAACGGPIGEARLEARPEARLCVRCQEAAEARRQGERGAEAGPPHRGLDVWELLAAYGSSDTPSDGPQAPDAGGPGEGLHRIVDPRGDGA
jgi:RNA polymerase-binding transcription factor DksA